MKKIGMFYGAETVKTKKIAKEIIKAFADADIEVVPVEKATQKDFEKYENMIAGVATWFDGELPMYWDEAVPEVESSNLKGKKVAIFGLGDQVGYPDNFADAIGILAEVFAASGATIVGKTEMKEYAFDKSQAQENEKFLGLIIDIENQSEKNGQRIKKWVAQLKKELS